MKNNEMPICFNSQARIIWGEYVRTVDALDAARAAMDRIRPTIDEYGENYERALEKWGSQVEMLDDLYQEIYHSAHVLKNMGTGKAITIMDMPKDTDFESCQTCGCRLGDLFGEAFFDDDGSSVVEGPFCETCYGYHMEEVARGLK